MAGGAFLVGSANPKSRIMDALLVALVFIAGGVYVYLHQPAASGDLINPVAPTVASIDAGKAIYDQKCSTCHGPNGLGDGPVGLTLNPRPANLSIHAVPGVHTDGQLFAWITNGYPNSAMPGFKGSLTDEQRWDLVNFIRTFAPK
jgi:mono/diheme cytochrome c family protein